uniref:Uncharacterized protein n=1 Tax=Candidatus Kentrum sp. LPFa TaxID=2126335 RepID=A0A450WUV5_9GAMM|nr:MAG: hypothetical protein BECKLPF1236A_GA0070988_102786 [Candidatus Kentron sp. LPFa]
MATKFGFGYVSKYLVDLWTSHLDRPSPFGIRGQPGQTTSLLPTAYPLSSFSPIGSRYRKNKNSEKIGARATNIPFGAYCYALTNKEHSRTRSVRIYVPNIR